MSKPAKANTPQPYPPVQRKPSQNGVNGKKQTQTPTTKFYDGPTVSAKAQDVKVQSKAVAKQTAKEVNKQGRRAVAAVKRHPWSLISLITTIPFLVTLSLFSTIVCPLPSGPSPLSKFVLSPLGLHDSSSQHSQLHQTLCYPASVYQSEFLQPYIYPIVENLENRAYNHPIYKKALEPAYTLASTRSKQLWQGPIRPIVNKIVRSARKAYLTFVDPHIPLIKAKTAEYTAPLTTRVSALHQTYLAPHLATAQGYAQAAGKSSAETYRYVKAHPITGQVAKYANKAYRISRKRSQQAYKWARPHVIRYGKEAKRITREILGPRVIRGLKIASEHGLRAYKVVEGHVVRLYYRHLDPHVGPHLAKARVVVTPYISALDKHIYKPYIFPALEAFLPAAILAPEPPKSFWALMADILPSMSGGHVAERRGQMDDFYKDIKDAKKAPGGKPASVPIPGKEKVAKAESATKDTKAAKKMDRSEMDRVREAIKERVEQQGKKGYKQVHDELVQLHSDILSAQDQYIGLKGNAKLELEREFEYILKGLDKLYTSSSKLTREQVAKSAAQGEARVQKRMKGVKDRVELMKGKWFDAGKPIVRRAMDGVSQALGTEYADLAAKMAWIDDITPKDWTKYNALQDDADAWSNKYMALHKGDAKEKALLTRQTNIDRAIADLNTEIDDMYEGFRARVRSLGKTANERIEAREALAAASPSTDVPVVKAKTVPEDAKATILPIVEAGAGAAVAAGAIIGKGKDQIMDALSQANAAVVGEASPSVSGYYDQAKDAAASAFDAVSSGVHDATRSAGSAVGVVPTPESLAEHAESLVIAAQDGAQSVYEAGSSVVHQATRSAMSAVGATPSPEGVAEHAQSVVNAIIPEAPEQLNSILDNVAQGYASVAGVVGDNVHDATRAAMRGVGVSPAAEGVAESAESIVNKVAATAASAYSDVAASAASIASDAGSAIHDGTRSAMKAVGVSPTPESVGEHVESVASAISSSAASLASAASASASSVASDASSLLHDATRTVVKAVEGTPSPETPGEHVESIVKVVTDSAAEVFGAATTNAGNAYTAVSSNAEGVYSAVSHNAQDAGQAIASQANELGSQIQLALGLASAPTPLASSASAYLASITAGASGLPDLLASGSSLLSALQSDLGQSVHQATRAASRAVGAKPTPESAGEYVEDVKEKIKDAASVVVEEVEEVTERVKRAVGREEL